MVPLATRLDQIVARLDALAARDPDARRFGASAHRYARFTPASEAELTTFEASAGIRLPEDYRAFVSTVASGGVGPGYGLQWLPARLSDLAKLDDPTLTRDAALTPAAQIALEAQLAPRFDWLATLPDFLRDELHPRLAAPDYAGRRMAAILQALTSSARRLARDLSRLALPFAPAASAAEAPRGSAAEAGESVEQDELDAGLVGALQLCEYGCGIFAQLVVTGPWRGSVWVGERPPLTVASFPGPIGVHGREPHESGTRTTFIAWFEDWLGHAEAAPLSGPFTF